MLITAQPEESLWNGSANVLNDLEDFEIANGSVQCYCLCLLSSYRISVPNASHVVLLLAPFRIRLQYICCVLLSFSPLVSWTLYRVTDLQTTVWTIEDVIVQNVGRAMRGSLLYPTRIYKISLSRSVHPA